MAVLDTSAPALSGAGARYQVRRITWKSALKVGAATGWLLSLVPAMVCAWLVVRAIGAVYDTVAGIQPMEIGLLGQNLATIDPLQILGQQDNVARLAALAASGGLVFLLVTFVLTFTGAVLTVIALMLFVGAYNLLAGTVGGLEVELAPLGTGTAVAPTQPSPPEIQESGQT